MKTHLLYDTKSTVRMFVTVTVMLSSMFMLTACDDLISGLFSSPPSVAAEEVSTKPLEPTQITAADEKIADEEMPPPFASSDADAGANFYQPCNRKLDNIPVELLSLVPQEELDAWYAILTNMLKQAPSNLNEYTNIYSFIVKFNIPDDAVWKSLEVYLLSDDPQIALSREDVAIILSRDEKLIVRHFASAYSIAVNENLYSPQWVYTHTADDYESAGITKEAVSAMVSLYGTIDFSDASAKAFADKLSGYTGEKIELTASAENIDSLEPSLYAYRDYFTLTFPPSWNGRYHIEEYVTEQDHNGRIEIAHAATWEADGGGGVIGTVIIYPSELWEEYKADATMLTLFGEKDGLSFVYALASDVQYDAGNEVLTEEYKTMYGEMPEIFENAKF